LRATLVPVERKLALTTYQLCLELFGPEVAASGRFEKVLGMALTMMQGLALLAGHELGPRQLNRAWATYRDELVTLFRSEDARA
jgi:hypothetical protein